jgi:hypothetical protein
MYFIQTVFLLALATNLNAAIGHRYTFKVGDKVDLKMFIVHDSVWSDTGRDNAGKTMPSLILQRTFSVTTLEVNSVTHAKVKVLVEHLTLPSARTKIDWPTSTRDIFMIDDGHLLAVILDSLDFVADPAEGFGFLQEVSPFAVPISRSQNAVFLEIGTYPDVGGDEKLRAFAFCDGVRFSELYGPLSAGGGWSEFPNGPRLPPRKLNHHSRSAARRIEVRTPSRAMSRKQILDTRCRSYPTFVFVATRCPIHARAYFPLTSSGPLNRTTEKTRFGLHCSRRPQTAPDP